MKKPALRLLEFAIKECANGNHVFVSYFPHVESIDVRAYEGDWDIYKEPIVSYSISIDDLDDKYVDRIIEEIKIKCE